LKNILVGFLAAVQFLTIAPPLLRRPFTPQEMGRAVGFFPLVGLLLGGVLLGLDELLRWIWPDALWAGLVLVAWVLATGGLHLDGFLDSCDGLLGGRGAEERLRIMKDERVGAYAVVGGVLLLLVKFLALSSVPDRIGALLVAPTLGRWGMVLGIRFFPYARAEGLGRSMKDHAGGWEVLLASLTAGAVCWLAGEYLGVAALALTAVATCLAVRFTLNRLPGLTGDIYGALCEIVEVLVLLLFAARIPS
jgi:adenosylcobinamide-GDP ribazoletransferase